MIYRKLGSTNKNISILSFGTMRLPRVSVRAAVEVINKAYLLGINFFETSPGYKNAERKLGIALKLLSRSKVYIATKSHPDTDDTRAKLRERIEASLDRLDTSYIDFYQVWGLNTKEHFRRVFEDGLLDEIKKAQKEGLIKHIGFTSHGSPAFIKRVMRTGEFEWAGIIYNLFKQDNKEVLEEAYKLSMGIIAIAPLSNGFLAHPTKAMTEDFYPYDVRDYSLFWLCNDERITTITAGMKTMNELMSNYKSIMSFKPYGQLKLEIEEHENKIWKLFKLRNEDEYCGSCKECLPCHKSINIPELMRISNIMKAYDASYYCKDRYRFMGNGGTWYPGLKANNCDECMDCEMRCPYKLKIVNIIKRLHGNLYDGTERGSFATH